MNAFDDSIKKAARTYLKKTSNKIFDRWKEYLEEEMFIAGAKSPEAKVYWQDEAYSKDDIIKAFNAGHESARLKGSYKVNGTFKEDLNEYLKSIKH